MNPIQAAEQLKNLSDQQLMSAGQNPVAVPPYLVLAEMKRREQLRAEYAKAQQGQQQQQPVIQQVAQNLVQGQPQQPQQQQPQAQGIMQAMPQGAVGMAGGGHVARHADGGLPSVAGSLGVKLKPELAYVMSLLEGQRVSRPTETTPSIPLTMEEIDRLYPATSIKDKIASAKEILGSQDYSQYENFLAQQMREAKSRKPRFGDALIAAGAAMASNRDPRVGIANVLAQGIGAGAESYRAQQEKAKRDLQTAMMAQMALGKMKQEDLGKRVDLASQLASSERGERIAKMQMLEHARIAAYNKAASARTEAERRNAQVDMAKINAIMQQVRDEDAYKKAIDVARIGASSRFAERPPTAAQAATDRGNALASDALMQAEDYLSKKGKLEGFGAIDLALSNLKNPNYFAGFKAEDRMRAASALRRHKTELQNQYIAKRKLELAEEKQSRSANDIQSIIDRNKAGLEDDDIKDAIGMGAVPR